MKTKNLMRSKFQIVNLYSAAMIASSLDARKLTPKSSCKNNKLRASRAVMTDERAHDINVKEREAEGLMHEHHAQLWRQMAVLN